MDKMMESAQNYVLWDPNDETKAEMKQLIDANKTDAISSALSSRLPFGTAGLRGPMGVGYNRMNDLVILQTTQGLCRHLESEFGEQIKTMGVVIGYDHRESGSLCSRSFARISAAVFLSQGIKVLLLEGFAATPFVSFGVLQLKAAAGIMVTASHNPKADNGFKIYSSNGCQIIPPHDTGISHHIALNLAPWNLSPRYQYDDSSVLDHALSEDVTAKVTESYYKSLESLCYRGKATNATSTVRVAYTAMHGVGTEWAKRSFEVFGHVPFHAVPSQCSPDATFPTVKFPNPEEKGALNEAMLFANEQKCTVIVANDPDADRLAVAEWDDSVGGWTVFSGNELGVLFGVWQILQYKRSRPVGSSERAAVLASVVSSRMLKAVAEAEGIEYYDTLTGFKWIGNRNMELQKENVQVLFSYEEAIGFCCGSVVPDKDGVSAVSVLTEMASELAAADKGALTLKQYFQEISEKYGQFVSYNSYLFCYDPAVTDRIFSRIRTNRVNASVESTEKGYWKACAGSSIVAVKDITMGYNSSHPDGISDLPPTPEAHMIMFSFENGCSVTLRTSGTEPKIKFYTEMAGKSGESKDAVVSALHTFVDQLIEEMLQPSANALIRSA